MEHRRVHELVSNSRNGLHIYFFKSGLKRKSQFHRITKLLHLSTNLLILPRTFHVIRDFNEAVRILVISNLCTFLAILGSCVRVLNI